MVQVSGPIVISDSDNDMQEIAVQHMPHVAPVQAAPAPEPDMAQPRLTTLALARLRATIQLPDGTAPACAVAKEGVKLDAVGVSADRQDVRLTLRNNAHLHNNASQLDAVPADTLDVKVGPKALLTCHMFTVVWTCFDARCFSTHRDFSNGCALRACSQQAYRSTGRAVGWALMCAERAVTFCEHIQALSNHTAEC